MKYFLQPMINMGISTFAELASATDYVLGSMGAERFTKDTVVPILGDETHIRRNSLRRLFTEAYTLAAGDLSRLCDPVAAEVKAKLLPGEREQRRSNLSDRLKGIKMHGEHEPSMTLINKVREMYEENALLPLQWTDLTKRETELRGVKTENVLKL